MIKKSSLNSQIALTQPTNSRYAVPVDSYAKAPLRRLFHFVAVLLRTDTRRNSLVCHDLHTLVFQPKTSRPLSTTSTLFTKHGGVYPTHFESPVPLPWTGSVQRPEPAVASQIAGLSTSSCRNRSPNSGRAAETAVSHRHQSPSQPLSVLTCNKKAICPTLAGNAVATNAVYRVIPIKRSDLQETDR
jgi:hypothetical protein